MRVDDPMLSMVATRRSAFRRSGAMGAKQAPRAFELIDLRQECQQFLRNLDCVSVEHTRNYAGLYRIVHPKLYRIEPD
jgi:hypothetical protein